MVEVTDMIMRSQALHLAGSDSIDLRAVAGNELDAVKQLVRSEHPRFSGYFESPKPNTTVCAIQHEDVLIGAVLLEGTPDAAESSKDAALACLVVHHDLRNKGIGSMAIIACCNALFRRGFERVIAEWVASVPMYKRLGFDIWRTRVIDPEKDT
jgi:predicted N-acetyltransferase YhbS